MEPRQRRTATRWIAPFACLLLVLPLAGCSIPSSRTMAAIPSEWRDRHPFGPDGNAARERGEWHVSCKPEEMAQHTAFAVEHIHEGDVLFRRGHSYHIPTRVGCWILTKVNNGRYSHVALAHWEGSQLWVYDVESQGTRKVPFEVWMLDVVGSDFAVKRLKPEYRDRIPKAIAFCEDAYRRKVPFDFSFAPSDRALLLLRAGGEGVPVRGAHAVAAIAHPQHAGLQELLVPGVSRQVVHGHSGRKARLRSRQ